MSESLFNYITYGTSVTFSASGWRKKRGKRQIRNLFRSEPDEKVEINDDKVREEGRKQRDTRR